MAQPSLPATALAALADIVGPDNVVTAPGPEFAVDGLAPGCLVRPADNRQVAAVIAACAANRWTVLVRGGGTKQDLGGPPPRVDVVLSTERLAKVREYTPRDQTVSVEAGLRWSELQSLLAAQGQRLPVDPPHADRATVGGVLANHSSGTLRFGLGTVRDFIIGIETVTPDGTLTKAGGKVVKNVAGYNLMALHTGAFGQLGVITAVNFKVRPQPRAKAWVEFATDSAAQLEAVTAATLSSEVRPVFMEHQLGPAPTRRQTFIGFQDDTADSVEWQVSRLSETLRTRFGRQPVAVRNLDFGGGAESQEDFRRSAVFKAAVPGSHAAAFLDRAAAALSGSAGAYRWGFQASLGNGIVYGGLFERDSLRVVPVALLSDTGPTADALSHLRKEATAAGGSLVLRHASPDLKGRLPVWGPERPDWGIMARIKRDLDPAGILNPGRLVPA